MTSAQLQPLQAAPVLLPLHGGDIPGIALQAADGARAVVSLHGGQLLSWTTADGREHLFLGARASAADGGAIRGGIPVVFPQFAARGPLGKHGFARLREWDFVGVQDGDAGDRLRGDDQPLPGTATFVLRDDADSRAQWPHAFALRLGISLGAQSLQVTLEVTNTDDAAFDFSCALHAYLRVDDLRGVALQGLAGTHCVDSARNDAAGITPAGPVHFDGEIDRIHAAPAPDLELRDGQNTLAISPRGFTDIVVWNPGAQLAARIADLADGEAARFLCVEPACVLAPVQLAAGDTWRASMTLAASR